jgi:hypothetical protein
MTKEEAIKLIDTHTVCFYNEIDSPTLQALHMAIEALSADVVSREAWNDVTEEYVNTVNAILAVMSAPSCLKEVSDIVSNINTLVVRCKDCKHRQYHEGLNRYYCEKYYGQGDVSDENYCQWGERREP